MKNIKIKTDKNNKELIIGIWVFICIAAKLIQVAILPPKYSYDGRRIFSEVITGYRSGDKGFDTASNFFSAVNQIFQFDSYEIWSVFLGIVGSFLLLKFIKESLKDLYLRDFVFLSCSLFLMNIYIFNISKEIIQIIILIPAVCILNTQWNSKVKIFVLVLSLLIVAFFLRSYFFVTSVIFLVVYKTFLRSLDQEKKKFWKNIGVILLIGILGIYVLKSYFPNLYGSLFDVRNSINESRVNSQDAQTMIVNVFNDDGSIITFMLNLIINLLRLMFPIALIRQGIFQILFLVYQMLLSTKLLYLFYVRLNKCKDENIFIAASLLISYFIVAAIFEPDYGSVIRHEMAIFPIMYVALVRRTDYGRET